MATTLAAVVGGGKARGAQCIADYHNCWASRRCCNPSSRCYTKTEGVRFAQCRPNGCIGTCSWECRVLVPGHSTASAVPEFGPGAQNLTQAVEAMKAVVSLPTAMPPAGHSERLGNMIDSWYFASLGNAPALSHLVSMSCGIEPCFAKFLAAQLGRVSVGTAQAAAALAEATKHTSWGLYSYPTIRLLMPSLRHDLRWAMREYARVHDPALSRQTYEGGGSHLIVHYRLGDFVTNAWCIPPMDVAAAAAALRPSVIEIMDGGVRHLDQVDGFSASPHRANRTRQQLAVRLSVELQAELEAALRAAVPLARVTRSPAASIDADWFRIAHAPLLVTAAGSFAVTAAIAGHGQAVRTPAADNLNFPDRGERDEEELAANWRTYRYALSAMRGR